MKLNRMILVAALASFAFVTTACEEKKEDKKEEKKADKGDKGDKKEGGDKAAEEKKAE